MTVTSQFYMVNSHKQSLIHAIQEDDPSYDPLAIALKKTPFIGVELFSAACDRVYFDGYYGPISASEWEEQDGRKPYTVNEARNIIARVLANVEDYKFGDPDGWSQVPAEDIRAEIVYWYRDIYPERYPHV